MVSAIYQEDIDKYTKVAIFTEKYHEKEDSSNASKLYFCYFEEKPCNRN
jgi:hypothetical protein